jgi:uncharacterized protein YciI
VLQEDLPDQLVAAAHLPRYLVPLPARGQAGPMTTSKCYFLLKLIPPRPTFGDDLTEEEGAVMAEHGAYWRGHMAQGAVVAFGPVAEPTGFWGLAVLETESREVAERLAAADPAIISGTMERFEIHPMLSAVVRPHVG